SPKPDSTRATRASMASGPSGPSASSTSTVPGPAAKAIRLMIEVPPTACLSFRTRTVASKPSAHLTNLAEARACRPLRLRIVTRARGVLSFSSTRLPRALGLARQQLAGDADVLAPGLLGRRRGVAQRGLAPDAGQLDQHRQVDPGQHLGARLLHDG